MTSLLGLRCLGRLACTPSLRWQHVCCSREGRNKWTWNLLQSVIECTTITTWQQLDSHHWDDWFMGKCAIWDLICIPRSCQIQPMLTAASLQAAACRGAPPCQAAGHPAQGDSCTQPQGAGRVLLTRYSYTPVCTGRGAPPSLRHLHTWLHLSRVHLGGAGRTGGHWSLDSFGIGQNMILAGVLFIAFWCLVTASEIKLPN